MEPAINTTLQGVLNLGTPHIAGYSFDGRVTGSLMIFDALCAHLGVSAEQHQSIREQVCALVTP